MGVIKKMTCDKLRVEVYHTRKELGEAAGTDAAAYIKDLLSKKESINVMFAAAPSQNEMLETLKADEDIDWTRVHAFHMDEYVGLDPAHRAGFRNFLKRAIFDEKPFASIYLLNGNAQDPEEEAARYERLLRDHPLDVCLLGVGENGHIAFNDPPVADFSDSRLVKVVELEERCRMQQVNDGCFAAVERVPTHALSVTIPGLMHAGAMFCSVPGRTKAEAIRHMLSDEISTACPATILRRHANARLYVDADSGQYIL